MDAREAKRMADERSRMSDVMGKLSPAAIPEYAAGKEAWRGTDWQEPSRMPLIERIDRRLRAISENAADLIRMQEILRAHPEFEQFIELQGLLNRRGV